MEFFTIASSSAGNCAFVRGGNTTLLIDAGVSAGKIEQALCAMGEEPVRLSGILLTHEHSDHIAGVEKLAMKFGVPVYASPKTWSALPFAEKLPYYLKHEFAYDMQLGDIRLDFCKTYHDAVQPVGMVLEADGKRLGYVTDTGGVTRGMLASLQDLSALVIEANHDRRMLMTGPYPQALKRRVAGQFGHLANEQAAELVAYLLGQGRLDKAGHIVLAHLSETNNSPDVAWQAVEPLVAQFVDDAESYLMVAPARKASSRISI